jgi:hypothetical protein
MTYYRIALQADQSTTWQWESRATAALDILFRVLKLYRTMPWDRIRVFCASSVEGLDEMLARENNGLVSSSITAEQLLNENEHIHPHERNQFVSDRGPGVSMGMAVTSILREQAWDEQRLAASFKGSRSFLEMRRLEVELGAGGDHDTPYKFAFPSVLPRLLAWTKLCARVRRAELEP